MHYKIGRTKSVEESKENSVSLM